MALALREQFSQDRLLYRGDREALSGSLDRIQRAASVILKAVSVGG